MQVALGVVRIISYYVLLLNVNGGLFASCFRGEVTSLKKIELK